MTEPTATGTPSIALAEFTAEDPIELSFADGETIIILPLEAPHGWLVGQNACGTSGLVPESYVQMLTVDADVGVDGIGEYGGDVEDDRIRDNDELPIVSFTHMGRARLLADFVAEADGELTVSKGDLVTLLRPSNGLPEGWLYARLGSSEGLVPETYVEPADPPIDGLPSMDDDLEGGLVEEAVCFAGAFHKDAYDTDAFGDVGLAESHGDLMYVLDYLANKH